jgi:hypothetical protein
MIIPHKCILQSKLNNFFQNTYTFSLGSLQNLILNLFLPLLFCLLLLHFFPSKYIYVSFFLKKKKLL